MKAKRTKAVELAIYSIYYFENDRNHDLPDIGSIVDIYKQCCIFNYMN